MDNNSNTRIIMTARELYSAAREAYSYVYFDIAVVEQYLREGHTPDVWLLYDYILSQDLAEEVEL